MVAARDRFSLFRHGPAADVPKVDAVCENMRRGNVNVSKKLKNDLTHVGSLALWIIFASSCVMFLAMLLSALGAQSLVSTVQEKAASSGQEVPQSFSGATIKGLYAWALFAAIIAASSGWGARAMWKSARRTAATLQETDRPPQ